MRRWRIGGLGMFEGMHGWMDGYETCLTLGGNHPGLIVSIALVKLLLSLSLLLHPTFTIGYAHPFRYVRSPSRKGQGCGDVRS